MSLPLKTHVTIIVLQQVHLICQGPKQPSQVVPDAKQAKARMDDLVSNLGADQRYLELINIIVTTVNMVADFDEDQVKTVGGLLYRVPLFIDAVLPKLLALK